jgi:hypothetical protein
MVGECNTAMFWRMQLVVAGYIHSLSREVPSRRVGSVDPKLDSTEGGLDNVTQLRLWTSECL